MLLGGSTCWGGSDFLSETIKKETMTKPNHVITCVSCGWRPDQSLVDLSDLGKHTHDEGKPPVSFSLLPYCPKDDRLLKVSRVVPAHDGRRRVHYDCTCHRSFRVVV